MFFGVISEKIRMINVKIIEPNKTFPPKCSIIKIVTKAEAKILAKLFPTSIEARRISGLLRSRRAFLAPLDFLDKFLSLTLLDAIIPVSEPEENAEKISSANSADSKKDIELVPKELLKVVN